MHITSQPQPLKKKGTNKLVLGFAAVVASAVIGTTGLAAATGNGHGNGDKPNKGQCASAGFKHYGQCVKEWAKHKNRPGGGYNGGHNANVNANINLELNNSNNNVIQVIINVFR